MPSVLRWLLGGTIVTLGIFLFMRSIRDNASVPAPLNERRAEARLAGRVFHLDIADTPELRRRGLAGRTALPPDGGMLFHFDAAADRVFWMKGMEIPIDIVWLRGGTISGIVERAVPPPPGAADAAISRFASPGPVDAVIELAAGRSGEIGLRVGQRVEILLP